MNSRDSCLLRTVQALERSVKDVPSMKTAVDEVAGRLAAGGKLWVAGSPGMVSELSCRAGGFMMIRSLVEAQLSERDVILSFPDSLEDKSGSWIERGGFVVSFGKEPSGFTGPCFPSHSEESEIPPSLAVSMPAWLFTGEMISALTRLGKMPVLYESIGAYEGMARITKYKNGEIAFHSDRSVPPVPSGEMAGRYGEIVCAMLRRVEREQRAVLERVGGWCRQAKASGKMLFMYTMGHLVPYEVKTTKIGQVFRTDLWQAGFRTIPKPEDKYSAGDIAIHIGYQHPPRDLMDRARPAGARVAYVCLRSDRDYRADDGVVWIDPMWNWPDACVPIEGYDVPLLPASGIVNAAIAWEIYRLQE